MSMDLVVGATGILGLQIVSRLAGAGRPVRALVRESSDPAKVAMLREAGAEIVVADLKQPESLARACAGVDNVILTASSTLSRAEGDSIETVDRRGNIALIDAAKAAGVKHVVFVSFPRHEIAFPLQDAKVAVETALIESGIDYTILQPPHFWEIWCSPALGFDVAGGKAEAFRLMNGLRIVRISNNLGDSKSLITHPATSTHQRLTDAERAAVGISPGSVRLSVGLEDAADLIEDLEQALAGV